MALAAAYPSLIQLPRGVLYDERSGSYDIPDRYQKSLLTWRDSALEQGLSELRDNPEYDQVQSYIDLIEGRHYEGLNTPTWMSKFTDNRIAFARINTLAYLTDIKPTIDIRTPIPEYYDQAEILKHILHFEWRYRRMDQALEEVIDHALFGTGYWKISCAYPGEFTVIACGMDVVIPIQQGRDLQDSSAICYRAFRPPNYFKQRWPGRSDGIEKEAQPLLIGIQSNQYTRPWNINEYTWNSMSPSMRYHKSRQSPKSSVQDQFSEFPLIELQEYWIEDYHVNESSEDVIVKDPYRDLEAHNYWYRVKPGQRLYPRKRLLVFGGNRVMYDGPSPYWHGMFPFAKLRLNPSVWSSGGISEYRDLKPLNQSINKIGAGVEGVVEKAINPTVISRDGAVSSTSWEKFFPGKAGGKLKLTPISNPTSDVRYVDPPNLPGYVQQYQQYLIATFREMAGMIDMTQMAKKKQVPGGDTIEQFKDMLTTPLRRKMRNLEMFLEDAGRLAVPCITQFFSKAQRMRILGSLGLTDQDYDFKPGTMFPWSGLPEEFHKNFLIEVTPGSLHAGSKDREKQMAVMLRQGGQISLHELYRRLEVGNADQIIKEMKEEAASGIGVPQPKKPKGGTAQTRGQKNGRPV